MTQPPFEPKRHNLEAFVLWCKRIKLNPKNGDSVNKFKLR